MAAKSPPPERGPRTIPTEFTVSSKFIGWFIGALAGLFGLIVAWNQLWDRVDNHWRLETTQATQDKKIAADIAAVKEKTEADIKAAKEKAESDTKRLAEKAELDTKRLAQRAEQGRSWLFWSVIDGKQQSADQWATVCPALRLPAETCAKFKSNAENLRQEALAAKRDATDAGKEK